ncbi:arabinogalactan endo-1,4-beta-galactosidase [Natronospira proteinivora]|uniref:Arabinogalactan endo-beta-1,4-galactanase n=1 Tax=Natronospira proteinivora TaxID=1807133 RepID=A0ABT1G5Q0_9GAMM|nr:glycosyl hydrolase 53 family protein [Natronospira proteinivora]MCP1726601.1 arabinogalactan endo-1,4-beta-galactosidase [Natronospira proteinivora]
MRLSLPLVTLLFVVFSILSCADETGGLEEPDDPGVDVPDDFRLALSISPFSTALLNEGVSFDGESDLVGLQSFYEGQGATEIFARVSTQEQSPESAFVDRSLEGALERAGVANTLSMPLNVEISLFRSYGDVTCQTPPDFSDYPEIDVPGPWHELKLDQMTQALRAYGRLVAERVLAQGVEVNVWNIGNEVDFGTAGVAPQPLPGACDADEGGADWYRSPDLVNPRIGEQSIAHLMAGLTVSERVDWLESELWPYAAKLMAAVADGVRQVDVDARFSTHISNSYQPDFSVAFYDAMFEHGFEPDQLGLSFYPSAASEEISAIQRVVALRDAVRRLSERFDRPVFIAEFAYPADEPSDGPFSDWGHAVSGYPLTDTGQEDLARDLASWAAAKGVVGIRPWAPDLITAGWEAFALFNRLESGEAQARPALEALLEGLENPDREALP